MRRLTAVAVALVAALAAPVRAQLPSHASARCVGGAIGCDQVDFRLAVDDGAPVTLDFFRLWVDGSAWRFTGGQSGEAEDALGPTFFAPEVDAAGDMLGGTFAPGFEAILDPALRVRAELAPGGTGATGPDFLYLAGAGGRPTIAGGGLASTLAVACVGGAVGCGEADFTFSLGALASADYFRLWLPGAGAWRFLDGQSGEAEDALGPNFFSPEISDGGLALSGTFAPGLEAIVGPTLRVRAQVDPGTGPIALPTVVYEIGAQGRPLAVGLSGAPVSAVPEPSSLALLAGGLAATLALARRRTGQPPSAASRRRASSTSGRSSGSHSDHSATTRR